MSDHLPPTQPLDPSRIAAPATLEVRSIDALNALDLDTWQGALPTITLDLSGEDLTREAIERLADMPALAAVSRLNLSRTDLDDAKLEGLLASGKLAGVQSIRLEGNHMTWASARALGGASRVELAGLTHLDVSKNPLGCAAMSALARAPALANLKSLDVSRTGLDADGLRALCSGTSLRKLEELDLSGCAIGGRGTAVSAGWLGPLANTSFRESLRRLNLSGCGLVDADMKTLASGFKLKQLSSLNLSHNAFSSVGFGELAISERMPALTRLDASHNKLDGLVSRSTRASFAFKRLEHLDMSSCHVGAAEVGALLNYCGTHRLQELRLGDNPALGDAGMSALSEAPRELGALALLDVSGCGVSAAGVTDLAMAEHVESLETLELAGNPIGASGLETIARARSFKGLRALGLSNTGLGQDAMTTLAKHIDELHVRSLDLSDNPGIDVYGARELALSKGVCQIDRLELSGTTIGEQGAKLLISAPCLHRTNKLELPREALASPAVIEQHRQRQRILDMRTQLGRMARYTGPDPVGNLSKRLGMPVRQLARGEENLGAALGKSVMIDSKPHQAIIAKTSGQRPELVVFESSAQDIAPLSVCALARSQEGHTNVRSITPAAVINLEQEVARAESTPTIQAPRVEHTPRLAYAHTVTMAAGQTPARARTDETTKSMLAQTTPPERWARELPAISRPEKWARELPAIPKIAAPAERVHEPAVTRRASVPSAPQREEATRREGAPRREEVTRRANVQPVSKNGEATRRKRAPRHEEVTRRAGAPPVPKREEVTRRERPAPAAPTPAAPSKPEPRVFENLAHLQDAIVQAMPGLEARGMRPGEKFKGELLNEEPILVGDKQASLILDRESQQIRVCSTHLVGDLAPGTQVELEHKGGQTHVSYEVRDLIQSRAAQTRDTPQDQEIER